MPQDYTQDANEALSAIADAGEVTIWKRFGVVGSFDVPMLFYSETRVQYAYLIQKPSDPVPVGTQGSIMGNPGWEPSLKDLVTRVNGQILKPSVINEINPNGTVIAYILSLSR